MYNSCHDLSPASNLAPHSHWLTAPRWDGWENQKGKSEKTPGLRQRQFNRQRKSCACKQSKTRNSFTISHRQAGVQPFPGKQGSIMCNGYSGRQTPSLQMSTYSFFLPSFIWWAWCHMVRNIPLASLGQLSLLCPLPNACAPPHWESLGSWKDLDYKHYLATTKNISVLSTFFSY